MCWPCRVVEDSESLLALFIASRSRYKAAPKRNAAEKVSLPRYPLPPHEYVWRHDTLRLMFPGRQHSVWLFWENDGDARRFTRYFVNMEAPFQRTAIGVDTRDHTLDIDVAPDLSWKWRDVDELAEHVRHGLYSQRLADEARNEGQRVIEEIARRTHPCLNGWDSWQPDPRWTVPQVPAEWPSVSPAFR